MDDAVQQDWAVHHDYDGNICIIGRPPKVKKHFHNMKCECSNFIKL